MLLGNLNVIRDARVADVGSNTNRRVNSGFWYLLRRFQLADLYRFEFPNVPDKDS